MQKNRVDHHHKKEMGEKSFLRKCALVERQRSQGFSFLSFPLNLQKQRKAMIDNSEY